MFARAGQFLSDGFAGLDALLFPPHCLVCQTPISRDEDRLCPACWQELIRTLGGDCCRRCGRNASPFGIVNGRCGACQDEEFAFDAIVRAGEYETVLRHLILAFKFQQRTEYAARLSGLMRDALAASGLAATIDVCVPVPLHWRRRLHRGYNQAMYLARGLKTPAMQLSTDLVRIRNTRRQWNLSEAQRKRNVKNAFAVRRGHPFEGKTVALIDDITTTGATLTECAKALKDAGAKTVYAVVVAVAHADN